MSMELLDKSGLAYFWTKIKAYVAGLLSSKADDSDVVHKAGDESVTGTKTFVGSKKIAFKQSASNDKLGFTLYNNSNVEKGYLEYNPTNQISGVPLMTLGNYATAAAGLAYVGFRKYSSISGANGAYNLLTPLISDAKAPFNLTTTYTNFFLTLGVTDGTTTVVTDKSGLLDISSLLPVIPSLSSTVTGSGNAITDISVSGHAITVTKGTTFLTSHQDISGKVNKSGDTMTGGLKISTSIGSQLRLIQGNYGVIFRNDGSSFYLLQTASGQAENGSWNNARPLIVNLSTGVCNINGNATTASSAVKLTTARKINGVSFDGSADVTLTAVVSSASRSADIAANGTFTVPSYIVGAQALLVYLDGCLSRQGDGWDEVGTSGAASTTIKFNQLVPAGMEIAVRVN